MYEGVDYFGSEADTRFSEINLPNTTFNFFNPFTFLRSENTETDMNQLKTDERADETDVSELAY